MSSNEEKSFKKIYILFDEELKFVQLVFFAKNDIMASRYLSEFVNSSQCPYKDILDKIGVYLVGEYCEQDAHFECNDMAYLHSLKDYKREEI